MQLRLLRLFLVFAALDWGVCIVGAFASWPQVNCIASGMGAKPIAYDPMLDYWLRMICGAFTLIGLWYLALALWPRKFAVAIPWFGWIMILEGVFLLVSGLRLGIGAVSILRRCSGMFSWRRGDFIFCQSGEFVAIDFSFTTSLTCFLSPRRGHHLARFLICENGCTNPVAGSRQNAANVSPSPRGRRPG